MALSPEELKASLRGVIAFGVTPFHDDLSVDFPGLQENAADLAECANVVVALGNNGESFSLSAEEQVAVGRSVVEQVGGRKPVLAGVGFSITVACAQAKAAEDYGADGILILPPLSRSNNDDGLFDYYSMVSRSTRRGVVLFQTPELNFSRSLLLRLSQEPNIVALKDEHGDMKQFVRQLAAVGERFEMLCGVGEILAPSYFALGVKAFTSGLINFMPEPVAQILRLLLDGKTEAASRIVAEAALPIFDLRAKRPGYTTTVIKEAMGFCGKAAGPVRPPLAALAPEDRRELQAILEQLGLLDPESCKPIQAR
jgi:5-dehydro-4-deoxyglucarate dehydratase